jgi:tight adherence protein B
MDSIYKVPLYQGVVIAGTVFVFMLLFLAIRKLREEAVQRRERRLGPREEEGVLVLRRRRELQKEAESDLDKQFDGLIQQSGLEADPQQVIASMALAAVLISGALYLWHEQIAFAFLGILLGIGVPLVVIWIMRGRHQAKLQQQLPDSLYLMARSLRAGTSLEQAIQLVGNEGTKPLADEFKRCAGSLELGLNVTDSLPMMAERVNLVDFNVFVSTVAMHQKTGGNLPLMLDRLAASARDRNQFRGQFWAATAQGRITSIALALAAPALVLGYLIFQPEFAQSFLSDPRGWLFLGVVAVLETIGVIWVWRILKIDY